MKVISKVSDLVGALSACREQGRSIGFVPTMGALHAGHASLVERCASENDVTVVSIFVNPTQFNDAGDLARYPRDLSADCALLERYDVDYVFAPTVEEIYPTPDTRHFEYPPFTTTMEGAYRPGHFNGVCQVVSRLFDIVRPQRAYFGDKDFQQVAVIRAMVSALGLGVDIVECPTIRDDDGLALSSRNTLLTATERAIAPRIWDTLRHSLVYALNHDVSETYAYVVNTIDSIDGMELEYFSIVDGDTFEEVEDWNPWFVVGCIAVKVGATPIRLIDHIRYK